jgi:hypothetical protein
MNCIGWSRWSLAKVLLHSFALGMGVSLFLAGCEDNAESPCGDGASMIRGTVIAGGVPAPGVMVVASDGGSTRAEYLTGPDGRYFLALRPGKYLLSANSFVCSPDGTLLARPPELERITLGKQPLDLDIRGGNLSVATATPQDYPQSLRCVVTKNTSYEWVAVLGGTRSDSARFEFGLIPPGVFGIGIELDPGLQVWLPGNSRFGDAEQFTVPMDRPVRVTGSLPILARITGSVRGSWQVLRLDRPWLQAAGTDGFPVSSTSVADDGTYTLYLIAERVRLNLRIGPVLRWMEDGFLFPQAGQVIEGPSILESGILVYLEGLGSTTRHDAYAKIIDQNGDEQTFGIYGTNPFAISYLEPGTYRLQILPALEDTWLPQWYDGASSVEDATPIVIDAEGIAAPVTFQLVEGGRIR